MRRRWIQIDGELVEVAADYVAEPREAAPYVLGDISPYRSTQTGETISGRAQHREHLKRHGLIEVGNETKYITRNKEYRGDEAGRKQVIADVLNSKWHRR